MGFSLHSQLDNKDMRFIAHRGLSNGSENGQLENHPAQVEFALMLGYDAEIDVWCLNKNKWYLGHDGGPNGVTYEVPFSFLLKKNLWLHCKNLNALYELSKISKFDPRHPNFFWHEEDAWTLTSHGQIWMHARNWEDTTPNSVLVILKKDLNDCSFTFTTEQLKSSFGICSKWVEKLQKDLK